MQDTSNEVFVPCKIIGSFSKDDGPGGGLPYETDGDARRKF